jgi:beta-lactamase regulating signal transducer with metallopeptidase domain
MMLILDYTVKVSIVLLLSLVGVRLLTKRSAAFRHWVLTAAVVAAAAVPVLISVLPAKSIQISSSIAAAGPVPFSEPSPSDQYYEVPSFPALANPPVTSSAARVAGAAVPVRARDYKVWVFWVWMAGVGMMVARLGAGIVHLVRLTRNSRAVVDFRWLAIKHETTCLYGISNRVRLLETTGNSVLATWGLLTPSLLLPHGAASWPEERIRVVLHHELAHVRRHDWLTQMIAEILRAFYWFNPLCWIACEAMVQESEQACDDIALNCGIAGSDYAHELLALTAMLDHPSGALSVAVPMARPSTLERRFRALLNPRENRAAVSRMSAGITIAAVIAIAGSVASVRVDAEAAPPLAVSGRIFAVAPESALSLPPLRAAGAALAGLFQQPPTVVPAAGGGSIAGIVVKFGTSEPIAAADVSLQMLPGPAATSISPPSIIQTAPDGKFSFRNLAAGNYRLVALRAEGFVVAEHGQRTPAGRGRPVPVAEGQQVANVTLAMMPTGSISGRIVDRDGEPLGRAQVQALQPAYREGRKILKIVQSVQTNDVGEYRLFWLPPGSYYISARPEDPRRRAVPLFVNLPGTGGVFEQAAPPVVTHRVQDNGRVSEEAFVLVYFPGTTDFPTASRVDLRPGDALGGVNFAVTSGQVRAHHVRGRVADANGSPVTTGNVVAIPRALHPNTTIPSATVDASGRFDIAGVSPGPYYIVGGNPLGIVPVDVAAADLENIVVTSSLGVELNGRVVIEGKAALDSDPDIMRLQGNCGGGAGAARCLPIRFNLVAEPALLGFPPDMPAGMPGMSNAAPGIPSGVVQADGAFTLRNLTLRDYRLSFTGLPPDWYIKSARLGATDPIASLVSFPAKPSEQLEVRIGTNGGRLEGRIVAATGQPVPSATVALVPEPSRRNRRDLYRSAVTDDAGMFRFQGIAPGDYKVFAWEEVEPSSWLDPEIVGPVENRGKGIRIADGSRETVEAVVIPAAR